MAWAMGPRGGLPGGPRGDQQAGVALMEGQDGLAVDPEQHQVGLPVTGGTAIRDRRRPLGQRAAQSDEGRRAAPLVATAPAFGFGLRQIVAPGVLCFAGHLRIDEAVDGLVGDDRSVLLPGETAGHLLGRPAVLELRQDRGAERAVAVELGALPAARPGLLVGIAWVGSPGWWTHCGSVLEPPSMARDPELPRFGGESVPWCVSGPFHSGLQG